MSWKAHVYIIKVSYPYKAVLIAMKWVKKASKAVSSYT